MLGKRWWIPTAFAILSLLLLLVVPAVIDLRITRQRSELAMGSDRARLLLNDLEAAFASQLLVRNSALASKDTPPFALPRHIEADQVELRTAVLDAGPHLVALYDSLDRRLSEWNESAHDGSARTAQDGLDLLGASERLESALTLVSDERRAKIAALERYFVLTPSVLAPIALIAILIVVSSGRRMRRFAQIAEEERAEVVHASEARAALLRGVTHDVKNPLGAAAGYAQLMEEGLAGPLEAAQLNMVHRIHRLVQSAAQTVADLLELARADGELHLEYATSDLAALMHAVVDDHEGMARAQRIEVVVAAAHTPVVTDPLRVRQILTNLVSNAIKYSPEGEQVRLSIVRPVGARGDTDRIGVEVRDSGPGIPAELRSKVFQEFFRVRSGGASAANGNGLGLAISRRLAQLLGGDVTFADAESGGAVFTLWLPASHARRAAETARPAAES
ncbi:MAG: HAMP domain-containing histidine kinase [Gemmatimonadaceae bacterium]|nr:HAMP domain-containing histidine kinase [Gemmatimonadaceae bacterium]